MGFLFVLIVGLLAGTISGIVGTGSSIMLMPVLVYQYGPKEAVPIMAVAAVMAYFSRILAWWREVDWRACLAYSITGIPAAPLGARTPDIALKGLIAGSSLMFGAFIAKRFVLHLEPDVFRRLMDGTMLAAGLSLLWTAFS
jgi:uncharacterized membrane protein YfcA